MRGKTTTLRTISGLLAPLSGELHVAGRSIVGQPSHRVARSGVGHVPEDRGLFRSLTVRENLKLARGCAVSDVVDWFPPLGPLLDRQVGLLSGGEQQMVAVGRALASDIMLLLLDELSLGLAPIIVETLLPVVRRAADERQIGILLVEQHVHLALAVADRAYALAHGALVLEGSAQTLADDPALLASSYFGGELPTN